MEGLLDLARDKFRRLLDEAEQLKSHGIRVKVSGISCRDAKGTYCVNVS